MGYWSSVKLILTDTGMKRLREKVKRPADDDLSLEAEQASVIYEAYKIDSDRYWLLEWPDTKWYDEPHGLQTPCAVAELRRELREQDEPFDFMRVGEDYEDVETDALYGKESFPCLTLNREIEVEY